MRHGRERGRKGEIGEETAFTIYLYDLGYESLQGVRCCCAKCLPCDAGSEVAWTITTALQQPRVLFFRTICADLAGSLIGTLVAYKPSQKLVVGSIPVGRTFFVKKKKKKEKRRKPHLREK